MNDLSEVRVGIPPELRHLIAAMLTDPHSAIEQARAMLGTPLAEETLVRAVAAFNPRFAHEIVSILSVELVEVFERLLVPAPVPLGALQQIQVLRTLVEADPALAIAYARSLHGFDDFIIAVAQRELSQAEALRDDPTIQALAVACEKAVTEPQDS